MFILKVIDILKLFLPLGFIKLIDSINYKIKKFDSSFDDEANKYFEKKLNESKYYAEYGSGYSTLLAEKLNKKYISIETSSEWIKIMKQKNPKIKIKYIDIGKTYKWSWGRPYDYSQRKNFKSYAESIFKNGNPDLILIDARLRVYCFLTAIKFSEVGTTILFDDYRDRGEYHIVEEIIKPTEIKGRMAIFKINEKLNLDNLDFYLNKFEFVLD